MMDPSLARLLMEQSEDIIELCDQVEMLKEEIGHLRAQLLETVRLVRELVTSQGH